MGAYGIEFIEESAAFFNISFEVVESLEGETELLRENLF
jgi:hypothetical protein